MTTSLFNLYEQKREVYLARTLQDTVKILKLFHSHFSHLNESDHSNEVITFLLSNSHLPLELKMKIATCDNSSIKYKMSHIKNLEPVIYTILSNDSSEEVRCGIASNKNVPIEILEKLKNDESHYVRNYSEKTLYLINLYD